MFRNILIILPAVNFNEQEFLISKKHLEDNAFKVFIASDSDSLCIGKNGLKIKPDVKLYNVHASNFSAVILIGGKGVKDYWNNKTVHNIFKDFFRLGKIVSAICSAPVALAKAGLLSGKEATCYSEDKRDLEKEGVVYVDAPVVKTGKIITGQNSDASIEFILAVINAV